MKPTPSQILGGIEQLVTGLAKLGAEGRDVYIALRAVELTIANAIEKRHGSKELATIQEIAFEVSERLKILEVDKDGTALVPP